MRPNPTPKTIWITIDDPHHSEHDEAFLEVNELARELKQKVKAVLAKHRGKTTKQWMSGGPKEAVESGVTHSGQLRMFEEIKNRD